MIYKVGENLFVGNQDDFYDQLHCELFTDKDAVILAGKVFHKQFARVQGCDEDGYVGNMDKNEPEYLAAYRNVGGKEGTPPFALPEMLVLNLLDIDNPEYVSQACVEQAVLFAEDKIIDEKNVVIFDTKAVSMAPAIAMLAMAKVESRYVTLEEDYVHFADSFSEVYPSFEPKSGINAVAKKVYKKICEGKI